jgi:hypothetical protein
LVKRRSGIDSFNNKKVTHTKKEMPVLTNQHFFIDYSVNE